MLLVKSTAAKVSLPTSRYDVLTVNINEYLDPNPYFGHRFETALRDACLPRDDENELRLRARRFIVELFNQLRQRLPENIQCLQKASLLSVEHALKATQEPITELAAQFLSVEAVSACETQWRNLRHVKWCCTDTTDGFWAEVGSYRDAHGDNPFAELDTLAMTVLSLPFSNAGVERCFSDMSIVKSKRRNRLDIYTLNALLTVRNGLRRHKKNAMNIACQVMWWPKSVRWHRTQRQRTILCKLQTLSKNCVYSRTDCLCVLSLIIIVLPYAFCWNC